MRTLEKELKRSKAAASDSRVRVSDLERELQELKQELAGKTAMVEELQAQANSKSPPGKHTAQLREQLVAAQAEIAKLNARESESKKSQGLLSKAHEDAHKECRTLSKLAEDLKKENEKLRKQADASKLAQLEVEVDGEIKLTHTEVVVLQEENRELKEWGKDIEKQWKEEKQLTKELRAALKQQQEDSKMASKQKGVQSALQALQSKKAQLGASPAGGIVSPLSGPSAGSSKQQSPLAATPPSAPKQKAKTSPTKAGKAGKPEVRIIRISASDPEHMIIENVGSCELDVEDWMIKDNEGKGSRPNKFQLSRSEHNPGPFVLAPGQRTVFWFSPLRKTCRTLLHGYCNPDNFFATTQGVPAQ